MGNKAELEQGGEISLGNRAKTQYSFSSKALLQAGIELEGIVLWCTFMVECKPAHILQAWSSLMLRKK